jgi:hypothetical protein
MKNRSARLPVVAAVQEREVERIDHDNVERVPLDNLRHCVDVIPRPSFGRSKDQKHEQSAKATP